jgi:hypothetical protein
MATNPIDFLVKNGLVVSTTATVRSASNSTSTTTGALIVSGGVGIGKDLQVGGNIYGSGITISPAGSFPLVISSDQTITYYTGTNAGSIIFTDGSIQSTRGPIAWTNNRFMDVANYYSIDPGIVFSPVTQGGYVQSGDTYFDDGTFGGTPNHIYMMLDQGNGLLQFFDITPTIM